MNERDHNKQEQYRIARTSGDYDSIWKNVGSCAFCDLNNKYIFFEENGIVMTVALYAYTDGHFMVIPRRHIRSVKELSAEEWETMRKFFYLAKKIIRQTHGIKGMQIVQKDGAEAQSTVEHLHFHCIPFDDPGLCKWNYKDLEHTPAENAKMYKQKAKMLEKLSKRFGEKYD